MVRAVLGVIVGYALWSGLWLGGNQVLFQAAAKSVAGGLAITDAATLLGLLALSLACSLVGGAACGGLAKARAIPAAAVLGALLLATGIAVQASAWKLMPTWYHASFLVLLVPLTLAGAVAGRKLLKSA